MTGSLDGKVALITGIARGQERAHALRLAAKRAKIIGFDICRQIEGVPFGMGTPEDLAETEQLVRKAGGDIVVTRADVREPEEVAAEASLALAGSVSARRRRSPRLASGLPTLGGGRKLSSTRIMGQHGHDEVR